MFFLIFNAAEACPSVIMFVLMACMQFFLSSFLYCLSKVFNIKWLMFCLPSHNILVDMCIYISQK